MSAKERAEWRIRKSEKDRCTRISSGRCTLGYWWSVWMWWSVPLIWVPDWSCFSLHWSILELRVRFMFISGKGCFLGWWISQRIMPGSRRSYWWTWIFRMPWRMKRVIFCGWTSAFQNWSRGKKARSGASACYFRRLLRMCWKNLRKSAASIRLWVMASTGWI